MIEENSNQQELQRQLELQAVISDQNLIQAFMNGLEKNKAPAQNKEKDANSNKEEIKNSDMFLEESEMQFFDRHKKISLEEKNMTNYDSYHKSREDEITILQCPICMEDYNLKERQPMILKCGHSLCQKCIKAIYSVDDKEIQCPFDKQIRTYKSLKNVTKNFSFVHLLECQQKQNKEIFSDSFCEIHNTEKPMFYCTEDKKMICQFCLLKEHKNHKFESAQPIQRGRITKEKIEKAISNYNQWIRMAEAELQLIQVNKISTEQEINKHYIKVKNSMQPIRNKYLLKNELLSMQSMKDLVQIRQEYQYSVQICKDMGLQLQDEGQGITRASEQQMRWAEKFEKQSQEETLLGKRKKADTSKLYDDFIQEVAQAKKD